MSSSRSGSKSGSRSTGAGAGAVAEVEARVEAGALEQDYLNTAIFFAILSVLIEGDKSTKREPPHLRISKAW